MPGKKAKVRPAEREGKLREQTRETVREEIEEMREGVAASPSVTDAVADALFRARQDGARSGLPDEEVLEITREQARRVLADELADRGRRSAKKSKKTTQILDNAEARSPSTEVPRREERTG